MQAIAVMESPTHLFFVFFAIVSACSKIISKKIPSPKSGVTNAMAYVKTMAEEIAMGKGGAIGREGYACAARILIDYGKDIHGAIDMLLKGEMWSEARRLALLHDRGDLIKRCTDSAASYAEDCLEDFENRSSTFVKTNKSKVFVSFFISTIIIVY